MPAELWLRIGTFAVIFPHVICVNHLPGAGNNKITAVQFLTPPPICQVSGALRKELLPLYYGENIFHISNEQFGAGAWLSSIGDARWRWMRDCYVSTSLSQPRQLLSTWDMYDSHDWDFASAEEMPHTIDRLPRCAVHRGVAVGWPIHCFKITFRKS